MGTPVTTTRVTEYLYGIMHMKANNGLSDIWVTVVVENRSVRVDGMGLPYPFATIRFHGSVTRPKEFDAGANCTFSGAHSIHIDLHIDGSTERAFAVSFCVCFSGCRCERLRDSGSCSPCCDVFVRGGVQSIISERWQVYCEEKPKRSCRFTCEHVVVASIDVTDVGVIVSCWSYSSSY